MFPTTSEDTEEFSADGVVFRSYARTATGAGQLGAWEADFPPNTPGVPHRMTVEEVFRLLSGRLVVEIGDQRAELSPGDVVRAPAGVRFRVSNESGETASAWVATPLGMAFMLDGNPTPVSPPWAQ